MDQLKKRISQAIYEVLSGGMDDPNELGITSIRYQGVINLDAIAVAVLTAARAITEDEAKRAGEKITTFDHLGNDIDAGPDIVSEIWEAVIDLALTGHLQDERAD